jgi:hypothetical protein
MLPGGLGTLHVVTSSAPFPSRSGITITPGIDASMDPFAAEILNVILSGGAAPPGFDVFSG